MMSPFSYIAFRYKNCSLQTKLFTSYFLLIFIPIIVLTFFAVNLSTKAVKEQSIDIAQLYLTQAENEVKSELDRASTLSYSLAQDSGLHDVLEKADKGISFSEEYDDMKELRERLETVRTLYGVEQIRLYISDSFLFSRNNYVFYPLSSVEETDWYKELKSKYGAQLLLPSSTLNAAMAQPKEVVSVVTLVRSEKSLSKVLGVVRVDILKSRVLELLALGNYTENGVACLVDNDMNLILSEGTADSFDNDTLAAMLSQMVEESGKSFGTAVTGESVLGLSQPVFGGYRIYTADSIGMLLSPVGNLRDQIIWLTVVISIIAFSLSYIYARGSTKRIKSLAKRMQRVEKGDLDVSCIVDSGDEIGELQNSFNFMVRRISTLIDEQYNLGKNLKDMELRALQAQINPHFLYNTLDLIFWKATESGNSEIADTVVKLARFYRLSLSNGSDFLPLAEEIEHVRLFVELTNLCRGRSVELITELDPDIEKYPIMKLILQPIVENALFHGLYELDGREGTINLKAWHSGDYVYITVNDNGVGIEKAKLSEILAKKDKPPVNTKRGGYGIGNVLERLRIYYDNDFDFEVNSAILQGTSVNIKIPYSINGLPIVKAERIVRPTDKN